MILGESSNFKNPTCSKTKIPLPVLDPMKKAEG
jgi:hypothetical protein